MVIFTAFLVALFVRTRASKHGPVNDTRVHVESEDVSCDFTVRFESDDLTSLDLLIEALATATSEAVGEPLDLIGAVIEREDAQGKSVRSMRRGGKGK